MTINEAPSLETMRSLVRGLPNKAIALQDGLEAIALAGGDIDIAAVTLGTNPDSLIASILADRANADQLDEFLRSYSKLRLFKIANALQTKVEESLDDLNPKDVLKAWQTALEVLGDFSSKQSTLNTDNMDQFQAWQKRLPDNVRKAMHVLNNDQEEAVA